MFRKPFLDLSLYLVTDSTPAILGENDLVRVVRDALDGGVTIVQYREKHADTGHMIEVAKKLHQVTKEFNVPLLINDRIDVALAAGVEGVHIGQDDVDLVTARKLLPPNAIIGVTASSVEEAARAIGDGADYLGIGTMFGTPTKKDTKSIIGTEGTRQILGACKAGTAWPTPCVAIGGINASNVHRILHQTTYGREPASNSLNGIAVVSAIMAAPDPKAAAHELKKSVELCPSMFSVAPLIPVRGSSDLKSLAQRVPEIIKKHASASVLCHNMTNTVVQNFAANVCLATGSSPIMSMNGEEAPDLAKLGGALVINMGTVTPDILNVYIAGVKAYNMAGNPVLLDPVGGGATSVRRQAIKMLLQNGFYDVIKGNEGEISAVMGTSSVQQRGVDSGPSSSTSQQKADLTKTLAQRERCIVLMTGAVDYLSDGRRTVQVSNGSKWLGNITGSGCALGSVVASYLAVHGDDKFLAVLSGLLHYEIAAEQAVCSGPGTFIPAFIDQLYQVRQSISSSEAYWSPFMDRIKIQWV